MVSILKFISCEITVIAVEVPVSDTCLVDVRSTSNQAKTSFHMFVSIFTEFTTGPNKCTC
jgi:hypothetical protein